MRGLSFLEPRARIGDEINCKLKVYHLLFDRKIPATHNLINCTMRNQRPACASEVTEAEARHFESIKIVHQETIYIEDYSLLIIQGKIGSVTVEIINRRVALINRSSSYRYR